MKSVTSLLIISEPNIRFLGDCVTIPCFVISTNAINLDVKMLRFLTFVRNDISPYYDKVS